MKRNVLVGLMVLVAAVGVYITNFIVFRHDLTATWLAEVTFTIPDLTSEQIYLIERRQVDTTQTEISVEHLYFNDHNHLWVEKIRPADKDLESELWLYSPTTTMLERHTLAKAGTITQTTQSMTDAYNALYQSAFYDWYRQYTKNPQGTPTPIIARRTEWVENIECYRVDWETPTESVTTWLSADNYRLVKERHGSNMTYYRISLIPKDQLPFSLTLPNWLRYYHIN